MKKAGRGSAGPSSGLAGPTPIVASLRTKVAETENSLWYNPNRNLGKLAGGLAQQGDYANPAIAALIGSHNVGANTGNISRGS